MSPPCDTEEHVAKMTAEEVKNKTKAFLSDRKHANNLIEVLSLCEVSVLKRIQDVVERRQGEAKIVVFV